MAQALENATPMRFIIRNVRTKPATPGNYEEFDEFCESVLGVLDRSSFFTPDESSGAPPARRADSTGVQLLSALCVT